MKIVYNTMHQHQDCREEMHYGELVNSYENATRMDEIYGALTSSDLHDILSPEDHGDSLIVKVHDQGYIDFLRTIWDRWSMMGNTAPLIPSTWSTSGLAKHSGGQSNAISALVGRYSFAADAPVTEGTWQAVYMGAQTAITAQQLVSGGDRVVFALTRPPGHHAHSDLCGGYCYINNAAVAAEGFIADGKKKVAILDIDFHHGNGTQDIFYARKDVLTISLHGDPESCFPFYLGFENEIGTASGVGFNRNFPMPLGTGYAKWENSLKQACGVVREYGAEALVIPLGVDTHENDPISGFKLTSEDYKSVASILSDLKLPTVITMEGGYDMESLGANVTNFINSFE